MKSFLICLFSIFSLFAFSQRDLKKLESSFDFGFGNHFGLSQIQEGFKVNSLTPSNFTFGMTNYFTNNKFGGRLELSFDKMLNNSLSSPFQTNYYRSTYYLNTSLQNVFGWNKSNSSIVNKKNFWQSFDIDLGIGVGYSAMTSKLNPLDETVYLKKADDMLNIGFRIAPSIEMGDKIKLFASYTQINHSGQSMSFDFTNPITNTAFKGSFRMLNVGIRYTPNTERVYDRTLKDAHKKWHFFTSFDASIGNHFAGKTDVTSSKFNGASISHVNVGANHKYPNSRLFGRFDLGFDAFREVKDDPEFATNYFRTTYQVIADLRTLRKVNNENNRMDLAFGLGIGFATLYNSESSKSFGDRFLNGDDMYALVFSVNPSYRISKNISVIANATLTSHSLQTRSWDMFSEQSNTAFNARFMNMSLGLRYHMADRRVNYTTEIVNRIPRIWSIDAAVGSHFAGAPVAEGYALSGMPAKHFAVGLNHPFINPIYYGRFEFAFDELSPNSSSTDFTSNYFRANYFLMTSVQNQLRKSISSERPNRKFDVQFGLGVGASTFKGNDLNDKFITKGDDMLNMAAKIVPTYKLSEKVSVFAAYTFVSHSLQSLSYDMSQSVEKTMFNGHIMNVSAGVAITLKSSKPRPLVEVTPIIDSSVTLVVVPTDSIHTAPIDSTSSVIPDPIVSTPVPTPEPVENTTLGESTRTFVSTISDYPVNTSLVPAAQKQGLKDLANQLKLNPQLSLVISGHADITGSEGYNLSLSRKRAANVKAYIISQGVPSDRIKIEFYGSSKPVASNETIEGRMKNRRVDIDLITPIEK